MSHLKAIREHPQETKALWGKFFWLLVSEYELSNDNIATIFDCNVRTVQNKKRNSLPPDDGFEATNRLSLLAGIKKNLEIIYPRNPEVCSKWLHTPRETFGSKSALDFILENPIQLSQRLYTVRRLLDRFRVGTINEIT